MNNKRREQLRKAAGMLDTAYATIEAMCSEEEDCMDNCPENLQESERYSQMESAVDSLNDAMEHIDNAKECIENAL
jgi:hypothetical protein